MELKEIVEQYKQTDANISDVQNKIKDLSSRVEASLQANNGLSDELTKKVDEKLTEVSGLQSSMRNMQQVLAEMKEQKDISAGMHTQTLALYARNNKEFTEQIQAMARNDYKGTAKLEVRAEVISDLGGGKNMVQPYRVSDIISPELDKLTIRDLLSWGRTASNAIEYLRESGFDNAADFVRENPTNQKPKSDITFDLESAHVQTLAHWMPVPKQTLDDVATLTSYLGRRLLDGLAKKEEQALLFGDGLGVTIKGINTQATQFSTTAFGDLLSTDSTAIDKIRLALLQAEVANYSPDAIVMNSIDWGAIELIKDKDGSYLFSNPHAITAQVLWGKKVVATNSMTQGNYLVGAFAYGAMGWDRENANVVVSTEDRDNFVKNMVTIRAEERLALTVFRPDAFVKGTL